MQKFILAIDQGTSSTRAILFDKQAEIVACSQQSFKQFYPQNAWVEHDAEEIWDTTLHVCRETISKANTSAEEIAALGISNQRETTIIWDKKSGEPIYPAIVWQDRRGAEFCEQLRKEGSETFVRKKTGLLLDPYFCANKLVWLLNNIPHARERARAGELAFGTIDSFDLYYMSE